LNVDDEILCDSASRLYRRLVFTTAELFFSRDVGQGATVRSLPE